MNRFQYLLLSAILLLSFHAWGEVELPTGSSPQPIAFPHFPSREHAFVWRNWPIVQVERLAVVLETSPENVRVMALSMGLPEQHPISPEHKNRIYITLIRKNWHLLPYDQLLKLLDMTSDELAHSLREDDFLYIKLGSLKPACEPLKYTPPTSSQKKRCTEIKKAIQATFGDLQTIPQEERFHFIQELGEMKTKPTQETSKTQTKFSPRFVYSYFAIYGDSLMDSNLESYSDGLLQCLSEMGVDGIWIHSVLRQMAPSPIFPEFGKDHEIRLQNLNTLVERAKQYGIGIYLYVNEPRAMPQDFFTGRENLKGVTEGEYSALCTSNPDVRRWISDSLEYIFKHVKNLAGVFTITASENLTNCASHGHHTECPNCSKRSASDIITEINTTIESGVHRGNPNAKVIVWDWGWRDQWAEKIIPALPKTTWLMSVSEWSKDINRGNVKTKVGEYSISVVGPGPRATKHWSLAKQAGLKTIAKMQINNTWEFSAVPYLPVMDLIAQHCNNLRQQNVDGLMLSWTLGGYPSPNMKLVQQFEQTPSPTMSQALDTLAKDYFGIEGAPYARKAWTSLSHAFQEYPYNGSVLYRCPVQFGPANLLYSNPTGYSATMIGFPYDDVDGWRGPYPANVFYDQFSKLADGWKIGIQQLTQAVEQSPSDKKENAQEQLRFAKAAYLHFKSVANQTRFTTIRNNLLRDKKTTSADDRKDLITEMKQLLESEIDLARRLYTLTCQDSRIGYEASNHYYYLPHDLMEKVINCRFILAHINDDY